MTTSRPARLILKTARRWSLPGSWCIVGAACWSLAWSTTASAAPADEDDAVAVVSDEVSADIGDDGVGRHWLDPQDPAWAPRRGRRFEIAARLGGEGSVSTLSTDRLPTVGGVVFDGVIRYYPVDRLAVIVGVRSYFGVDGIPAAGTTASTVISGITGVRYDLVRENRFSLSWDLYSGPALFAVGELDRTTDNLFVAASNLSVGGEMGTALAMRYSLGAFTAELRGLIGGRAGASASPFSRPSSEGGSGPFSALSAGADLGVTWSM